MKIFLQDNRIKSIFDQIYHLKYMKFTLKENNTVDQVLPAQAVRIMFERIPSFHSPVDKSDAP